MADGRIMIGQNLEQAPAISPPRFRKMFLQQTNLAVTSFCMYGISCSHCERITKQSRELRTLKYCLTATPTSDL